MVKLFLCSLLCCCFVGANAKENYRNYYIWINQAEESFINHDTKKCFELYDKTFTTYKEPFAKDGYIAAQMAYATGDTARFLKYLDVAFKNGMPITALVAAPILRNVVNNATLYHTIKNRYRQVYSTFTIDTAAIDSMRLMEYTCDSFKVAFGKSMGKDENAARAFIAAEEAFRGFVYKRYVSKGIFPSEKITGIKTETTDDLFLAKYHKTDLYPKDEMAKMFSASKGLNVKIVDSSKTEDALSNTLALNIFIHSSCTMKNYSEYLWTCVLNGYLHPKDYGMLEEVGNSWRNGPFAKYAITCTYDKKEAYYNILPYNQRQNNTFVTDPQLLKQVEKNRAEHLMQKYAVDVEKKNLEKEKGFKFFFGFMDFR